MFAIARIAKIKTIGNLAGSQSHAQRKRETPNADKERQENNRQLIGDGDVLGAVTGQLSGLKVRSNAVLAVDMFLGASPEYFRPHNPGQAGEWNRERLEAWVDTSVKWLHSTYGDRVVSAVLHLDEATPHIQAHLVPLDVRGKLNCRALFGGRQKLSAFQDSYAEAVAQLGLERGVRRSQAKHTDISQYYAQLQQAEQQSAQVPEVELPAAKFLEPAGKYRERATAEVAEQLAPLVAPVAAKASDRDRAVRQAAEYQKTAQQAQARAEAVEAEARERVRQVHQQSQAHIEQIQTAAAQQVAAAEHSAQKAIERAENRKSLAQERIEAAKQQVATAMSIARSEARAELQAERQQLEQQQLVYQQERSQLEVSREQVLQLREQLQQKEQEAQKVEQQHGQQLEKQGQAHQRQMAEQKRKLSILQQQLSTAQQAAESERSQLAEVQGQIEQQQETIDVLVQRQQMLQYLPRILHDLRELLATQKNGSVREGTHYRTEVRGRDYRLSAKDGRGVLLEVRDGELRRCELQLTDVENIRHTVERERQQQSRRSGIERD